MPRLFEQGLNATPAATQRIALGRAGVVTENMTITQLVAYMQANLTFPVVGADTVIIDIGPWNMQTNAALNLPYTPPAGKKIIGASAIIYEDGRPSPTGATDWRSLSMVDDPLGTKVPSGSVSGYAFVLAGNFRLVRTSGEAFDGGGHSGTTQNRGHVLIFLTDV